MVDEWVSWNRRGCQWAVSVCDGDNPFFYQTSKDNERWLCLVKPQTLPMSSERLRRQTTVLFIRPPKTMVDDCASWNRRGCQWAMSVCDGEQPFSLFPLAIPRRSNLWVIILNLVKGRDSGLKRRSMLAYRRLLLACLGEGPAKLRAKISCVLQ